MLTITHVKKIFYTFVKLSILLITKFKILFFIKHILFFLFLHSIKFLKYINNCFIFNFLTFLFNLNYQKLSIKLIKINWTKLNKNTNFFLNKNFSKSKNSIFIFNNLNFYQLFNLHIKICLLLIFNNIICYGSNKATGWAIAQSIDKLM